MPRKKKVEKDNSERWLLTYSDLMNLLMILFILLYAMSTVDAAKYEAVSQSLSEAFSGSSNIMVGSPGLMDGGNLGLDNGMSTPVPAASSQTATGAATTAPTTDSTSQGVTSITNKDEMKAFQKNVDKILDEYQAGGSIGSTIEKRGLVITFRDNVFFDSGKAELKDKMKNGLDNISLLLKRIDNNILVEGHTDNIPIKNSAFSSNWQLSAIRAANVAQYLDEKGALPGKRLTSVGYGENQPISSNSSEKGRSKNRRINLVILYDATTN